MQSAFEQFQLIIDSIRTHGTCKVITKDLSAWNMKETQEGTLIGSMPYNDGTVLALSVGPFQAGTSYPFKFGAVVRDSSGHKCAWFDWNEKSNKKHQNPHVHFIEESKRRYNIYDQNDWSLICDRLHSFKDRCGSFLNSNEEML
jgi:hypothetical protein